MASDSDLRPALDMISGRSRKGRKQRSGTAFFCPKNLFWAESISTASQGRSSRDYISCCPFLWLLPVYTRFRLQAFPAFQLCCVATVFPIVLCSYVMAGADDQVYDDVISREQEEYQAAIEAAVRGVQERPQEESAPMVSQFPAQTSQSGTQLPSSFPVQSHSPVSHVGVVPGVASLPAVQSSTSQVSHLTRRLKGSAIRAGNAWS